MNRPERSEHRPERSEGRRTGDAGKDAPAAERRRARPGRATRVLPAPLLLAVLLIPSAAPPTAGAGSSDASPVIEVVEKWSHSHRGKKAAEALTAVVEAVAAQVDAFRPGGEAEDRRLSGLRRLAAALEWPAEPKETQRFKGRSAKAKGPSGPRVFPLPKELHYRFGYRELMPLDEKNKALQAALRRKRAPTVDELDESARLEALLFGALPETELVVAEVERRLDVDPTADLYARFLETWRNWGPYGEESFYEALDRTAGTSEEVFFYDAMLADFVGHFAPEVGKRWSLQKQHDTNQQAFLAYRQYRGFVEAVAYSLVTPPDVALPARLSRYDYDSVSAGLFALRHQIDLLVVFAEGDVEKVVADLRVFLEGHPLPQELWTGYDPMDSLRAEFKEKVNRRVAGTGHSADELFREQRDQRVELAQRIRAATTAALEE